MRRHLSEPGIEGNLPGPRSALLERISTPIIARDLVRKERAKYRHLFGWGEHRLGHLHQYAEMEKRQMNNKRPQ